MLFKLSECMDGKVYLSRGGQRKELYVSPSCRQDNFLLYVSDREDGKSPDVCVGLKEGAMADGWKIEKVDMPKRPKKEKA